MKLVLCIFLVFVVAGCAAKYTSYELSEIERIGNIYKGQMYSGRKETLKTRSIQVDRCPTQVGENFSYYCVRDSGDVCFNEYHVIQECREEAGCEYRFILGLSVCS